MNDQHIQFPHMMNADDAEAVRSEHALPLKVATAELSANERGDSRVMFALHDRFAALDEDGQTSAMIAVAHQMAELASARLRGRGASGQYLIAASRDLERAGLAQAEEVRDRRAQAAQG